MGIYGAINAAVSGLTAQSRALENLSGNVANSQTIGYKRLDTSFSDMVSGGGDIQQKQVSGTAYATSRATNIIQGDIKGSDVDTYMAINGPGYFAVTRPKGVIDGRLTFSNSTYYTRAGDFKLDKTGLMVNSAGYYLKGFKLDDVTGNPSGDRPEIVQIDSAPMPAKKTTLVEYRTSLPLVPKTKRYDGTNKATALLDPSITAGVPAGYIPAATADTDKFIKSSISGGEKTIYNQDGTAMSVSVRWAKLAHAATTPAVVPARWAMYVAVNDGTNSYRKVGEATFDTNNKLDTLTAGPGTTIPGGSPKTFNLGALNINGTTTAGVEISMEGGPVTQFANDDGVAKATNIEQNGYPVGNYVGLNVSPDGRVIARYTNSQTKGVYKIPLSTFQAAHNLRRLSGAAFEATTESGEAKISEDGGSIAAKSVELSNADIASEFSKLIITQQAYSANSRVVTSSNDMLKDALNMVR